MRESAYIQDSWQKLAYIFYCESLIGYFPIFSLDWHVRTSFMIDDYIINMYYITINNIYKFGGKGDKN